MSDYLPGRYNMDELNDEFYGIKDEATFYKYVLETHINKMAKDTNDGVLNQKLIIGDGFAKGCYSIIDESKNSYLVEGNTENCHLKACLIRSKFETEYKVITMEISSFKVLGKNKAIKTEKEVIYSYPKSKITNINLKIANLVRTKSPFLKNEKVKERIQHYLTEYDEFGIVSIFSDQSKNTYDISTARGIAQFITDNKQVDKVLDFISDDKDKNNNKLIDLCENLNDKKDINRAL